LPQFNLAIGFSQNRPELKLPITSADGKAYKTDCILGLRERICDSKINT